MAPPGEERLILGHESLGRVVDPGPTGLEVGEHVAGIVRRPDPLPCPNCAVGEWDMCSMTLDSSVMNVSIATVARDVGTTMTGIHVRVGEVDGIQSLAVDVELQLLGRTVADPHGPGVFAGL